MARGKIIVVDGAGYLLSQIRSANRAALKKVVRYWHRIMMPKHFEPSAMGLYGYQKRKGDDEPPVVPSKKNPRRMVKNPHYSWRKRRQKRHNRPLVWSGYSRQDAMAGIRVTIRREKKSGLIAARGVMDVPAYFYKYKPGQPNKYAEMIRVTAAERKVLTELHNTLVKSYLKAAPKRVQVISSNTRDRLRFRWALEK